MRKEYKIIFRIQFKYGCAIERNSFILSLFETV